MHTDVLIVVLSLISSGFFSATEIAFLSANRLHIAIQKRKGVFSGEIISKFLSKPAYFLASILLGNTISLVVYGIFMTKLLEPAIVSFLSKIITTDSLILKETLTLVIQTSISTLIVLATAEFLPKSISLVNPDRFLTASALPMRLFYLISYPVVWLVVKSSRVLIFKIFGYSEEKKKQVFGLNDLNDYVSKRFGSANEKEESGIDKEILNNALEFKAIKVRDCMIPRKEIIAVSQEDEIQDLKKIFVNSGHSKIPVFKDSIDNIIGYCHHYHLFKKPKLIEEIITDIIIVPETIFANELMIKFISERKSMALVVDEFGGTSGIVTMEDIMEEIFGDIEDEHDQDKLVFKKVSDKKIQISARFEVEVLNEEDKLKIPEGEYDTLGGYLLDIHHALPQVGDIIETEDYLFKVIGMAGARIDLLEVNVK